jgi:hypothetical protein
VRLYSLTGATAVDHPTFGHITPADDGGFDFPGPLEEQLHSAHVRGERQWETGPERQRRMRLADIEHQRSPEALFQAVSQLVDLGQQVTKAQAPAEPVRQSRRKHAAPAATTPGDPGDSGEGGEGDGSGDADE